MMYPDAPVQRAIDEAYAVFARYPRPVRLDRPNPEDGVAMLRKLSSAPLRETTEDSIGHYAGSALYTAGTVNDYKHFLPRILDLTVRGGTVHMGLEASLIARKLIRADWGAWPDVEQRVLASVFEETWTWRRQRHPHEAEAWPWLAALATLSLDVPSALRSWLDPRSIEAVLQVCLALDATGHTDWSQVSAANRKLIADWHASAAVREAFVWAVDRVSEDDRGEIERGWERLEAAS